MGRRDFWFNGPNVKFRKGNYAMSKTLPEDQIGMVIAGLKAAACPGGKEVSVADDDLSALDQTQRLLDYIRTVPLKQRGPVIDLAYTLAQARTDAATEEAIALAEAEGTQRLARELRQLWEWVKPDRVPTTAVRAKQ